MGKSLLFILVVGVSLGLSSFGQISAQQIQLNDNQRADINKRINDNKIKYPSSLSPEQAQVVSDKCIGAKDKINVISKKVSDSKSKVNKKYKSQIVSVQKLVIKMKENGLNEKNLNKSADEFEKKREKLDKSYDALSLNLIDIYLMDCKTDPEGFTATLEAARVNYQTLKTDSTDLRNYIKNDLLEAVRGN